MAKIAIIGKGTAGCLAAINFNKKSTLEIDWYFDNEIKAQSVGEGSNLVLPHALYNNMGFEHKDLANIDGSFKQGILKNNWSDGREYMHTFPPPNISYHFSANKLQEYILSYIKDSRVNVYDKNVSYEDIDADFIMDCSGKPDEYEDCYVSDYIPVNSVYVTQCYWPKIEFEYTLTIARPWGWVFGIPLQNRCSIGYMYNNKFATLEQIKEDVKEVFEQYNLTPSNDTNSFSFNNYYRKENFKGRVAYNGNASFFLEPMEATSIGMMQTINVMAMKLWSGTDNIEQANNRYLKLVRETENVIMSHYFAGSVFKNEFWDYAEQRGEQCMRRAFTDPDFVYMIKESFKHLKAYSLSKIDYGSWGINSFAQNFSNLEMYSKLEDLRKKILAEQKS